MPAISLRELDKHMQADVPFIFPHEIEDGLYDWEDYCLESPTYEEDHGWYDDYDPFYYDDSPLMDYDF